MQVLIAIDPGKKGGIAVRDAKGRVYADDMPDTLADLWSEINALNLLPNEIGSQETMCAYIEDVGYHVAGNNASASATFARHVGHIEMALTAARISWQSVRPQKWMKSLGALPKEKADRKRKIKELMQRRYPFVKVTLQNADALAMLTWLIDGKAANAA